MTQKPKKISYIRKPLAKNSFICLGLAAVALFLGGAGIGLGVKSQGNLPVGGAAVCFSSFLFAVFGIIYGAASFQEDEKIIFWLKSGRL